MVLLTSTQVSVALSTGILFTFTFALFLAGYVLQRQTVNSLTNAIRPPPPLQPYTANLDYVYTPKAATGEPSEDEAIGNDTEGVSDGVRRAVRNDDVNARIRAPRALKKGARRGEWELERKSSDADMDKDTKAVQRQEQQRDEAEEPNGLASDVSGLEHSRERIDDDDDEIVQPAPGMRKRRYDMLKEIEEAWAETEVDDETAVELDRRVGSTRKYVQAPKPLVREPMELK